MKKFLILLFIIVISLSFGCDLVHKHIYTDGICECGQLEEEVQEPTYTYNYASSIFPSNWNPHTYNEDSATDILKYITSGLYSYDFNETKDGYQFAPDMAKSLPLDVTSEYVGEKWDIDEGEEGRVYKIDLKDNLKWEDGTPITATSFVESAKRLLDPKAKNYRASSFYTGDFVISNAEVYINDCKTEYLPATECYEEYPLDGSLDEYLIFTLSDEQKKYNNKVINLRTIFGICFMYDAKEFANYLVRVYLKDTAFTVETAALMEGKTLAEIKNDDTLNAAWKALLSWWQTEPNEELDFFLVNYSWPKVNWEDVGIFEDNGDLVLVFEKSIKGYYLYNFLTSSWLVHETTYDACIKISDNGIYTNSYGTTLATTKSYGPYKLTYFESENEYRFEKNENWYGYDLPENEGLYQTTNIVCKHITDSTILLQEFEKGNLDICSLRSPYIEKCSQSSELYYTENASTFFIAINPNMEGLKTAQEAAGANKNKTILTVLEFRQALSYAVDRVAYCLECDPQSKAAISMFNNLIISDSVNGVSYRNNEEAKDIILNYWGIADQVGEGKKFATKDEAIDSISGVDTSRAKEKFTAAYNYAIANNLIDEDDVVEIKIGLPTSTSSFYNNSYEFLVNCWTEAVKGTPFEGRLIFTKDDMIGSSYDYSLEINNVDMLLAVGWKTVAVDPYSIIGAYTDPMYQYDNAIDYTTLTKEIYFDSIIDVDGKEWKNITLAASVYDWSNNALKDNEIVCLVVGTNDTVTIKAGSDSLALTRTKILCAIESAVLSQYTMIPLEHGSTVSLKGKQVKYYSEEFIYGVGRGGIKYLSYNYSDQEWKKYVHSLGGFIDYTKNSEQN